MSTTCGECSCGSPVRVSASPKREPAQSSRGRDRRRVNKERRASRGPAPFFSEPKDTDPVLSPHTSDSDLTYWSSSSGEDFGPDDRPIPRYDKRLGKKLAELEKQSAARNRPASRSKSSGRLSFDQEPRPVTQFTHRSRSYRSESPRRGDKDFKKYKPNKGRKKRERQEQIRAGTFVPQRYRDGAQGYEGRDEEGKGKGEGSGGKAKSSRTGER